MFPLAVSGRYFCSLIYVLLLKVHFLSLDVYSQTQLRGIGDKMFTALKDDYFMHFLPDTLEDPICFSNVTKLQIN